MKPIIDHLVVSSPSLEQGISWSEQVLGVKPEAGGTHQGYGTHNVLLGLGSDCYMEIVSKDPEQDAIPEHWIPASRTTETQLIGWASTQSKLKEYATKHQNVLGAYASMTRRKQDGSMITWQMTYPRFSVFDGLVPFFINWEDTLHPGASLKTIGSIEHFSLFHPEAAELRQTLLRLGLEIEVNESDTPRIDCTLSINGKLIQL